jgi:hypothetical protein
VAGIDERRMEDGQKERKMSNRNGGKEEESTYEN